MAQIHWKNFSWQTINYAVSGVLLILLWVLIARLWSVEDFGRFSAIFSLTAIYGLVIELGLDFWVTQQTSLGNKNTFSRDLIRFRLFWAVVIAALFCFIGYLLAYDFIALLMFIFGALLLNIAHFFSCYLRGIDKLSVEALLSLARNVLFVLLAAIGIYLGFSLWWVAGSYFVSNLFYGLATAKVLVRYGFVISSTEQSLKVIFTTSIPVWIAALLFGLSIKLDILLLERWGSAAALGQFSSAARLFEGGLLVGVAFALSLYPQLSRQMKHDLSGYPQVMWQTSRILIVIGLVAAVVGTFIGQWLFLLIFGQQYQQAAQLFEWFVYVYPFSLLVLFLYNGLLIAHKSKAVIILLSVGVIVTLLMDWYLIPLYGAQGALWTYISKDILLLCGFVAVLLMKKQWCEKAV